MSDSISVSQIGLATMALLNIKKIGSCTARRNLARLADKGPLNGKTSFFEIAARLKKDDEAADAWRAACRQAEDSALVKVKPLCFFDDEYPARLRSIPDPPVMLYVRGSTSALHFALSVAVVGTRNPTGFGLEVARRIGRGVSEEGASVVSGLAQGCDTAAHWGCLEAKGVGVAVLAHGLEMVYPTTNRNLADALILGGGCLVSEHPVGTKPTPWAFASRDRLQSGLSDGVLVVETPIKDGTIHTVNFARKQERVLGCVRHPESYRDDPKIKGNLKIIQEGAHAVPDRGTLRCFLEKTYQQRGYMNTNGGFESDHLRLRPNSDGHQVSGTPPRTKAVERG